MTYFSNATDAEIYQTNWCHRCRHFKPDDTSLGCPVLNLHFDHAGDDAWRVHLDEMIPPAPAPQWHGECAFFAEVNMVPDRLYQPPPPSWIVMLRRAAWQLREMAEHVEEQAQLALEADGHDYAKDDPSAHVCDESCTAIEANSNTSLWLTQMWSKDEADAIEAYLAKHAQADDPQAVEMSRRTPDAFTHGKTWS